MDRITKTIENLQKAEVLLKFVSSETDLTNLFSEMNFRLDQLVLFSEMIYENIAMTKNLKTSTGIINRCPVCQSTEFIITDNFEVTCKICLK